MQIPNPSHKPDWATRKRPYSAHRTSYRSESQDAFAQSEYLCDPAGKDVNAVPLMQTGTTKNTRHVPGYAGYIPKTDFNETAFEHSKGRAPRSQVNKENVADNQLNRLPGYAGFRPKSAVNQRGNLRPMCLSTEGERFA